MEVGYVSIISIIGIFFQVVAGICIPIALFIYGKKKLNAERSSFFTGMAVYFIAVFVLKSLVSSFVIPANDQAISDSVLLYALYIGASVSLFEEFSRYIAFKFFMKDRMSTENAMMYGFGQGSLEAILLTGITGIEYFVMAIFINSGGFLKSLETMDEAMKIESVKAVEGLWTYNSSMFFLDSLDRVFLFLLQLSLSVLVYRGVKNNKNEFVAASLVIRFIIEFMRVVFGKVLPVGISETLMIILTVAIAFYVYKNEQSFKEAPANELADNDGNDEI